MNQAPQTHPGRSFSRVPFSGAGKEYFLTGLQMIEDPDLMRFYEDNKAMFIISGEYDAVVYIGMLDPHVLVYEVTK